MHSFCAAPPLPALSIRLRNFRVHVLIVLLHLRLQPMARFPAAGSSAMWCPSLMVGKSGGGGTGVGVGDS